MSYFNQQPAYYYDINEISQHYLPSEAPSSYYTQVITPSGASMTRTCSVQRHTSYSSSASASSSPHQYSSPEHLSYSTDHRDPRDSTQQSSGTVTYQSQVQKSGGVKAKPAKASVSYPCVHAGCASQAQFTRAADLERHMQTVHFIKKKLDCPVRRCLRVDDNGFTRKDHLVEHLRSFHMQDVPKSPRAARKVRDS